VVVLICAAVVFALSVERTGGSSERTVFWEAESTAAMRETPRVAIDPSVSGAALVRLSDGVLKYAPWIEVEGEYAFWGRVKWRDGCNDAVLIVINGEHRSVLGNDANYDIWHWVGGGIFPLHAGYNSIVVESYHENSVQLDCFFLTTEQDAAVDDGNIGISKRSVIAVNDDFFNGITGRWASVGGGWAIGDLLKLQHVEHADTGRAFLITGKDDWSDYSVRAAVRFPPGGSVGLISVYADEDNYCVTRIDHRGTQCLLTIADVHHGLEHILCEREIRAEPDRWYLLTCEHAGHGIHAFLDERAVAAAGERRRMTGRAGLFTDGPRGGSFDDVEIVSIAEPSSSSYVGRGTRPIEVAHHRFTDERELECWRGAVDSWLIDDGAVRGRGDTIPLHYDRILRGPFIITTETHLGNGSRLTFLLGDPHDSTDAGQRFVLDRTGTVCRIRTSFGGDVLRENITWFEKEDLVVELERSDRRLLLSINGSRYLDVECLLIGAGASVGVGLGGSAAMRSFMIEETPYYYYQPWDAPVGWTARNGEIYIGHVFFCAVGPGADAAIWNENDFLGEDFDAEARLGFKGDPGRYNSVEMVTGDADRGGGAVYGIKVEHRRGADGRPAIVISLRRGGDVVADHAEPVRDDGKTPDAFFLGMRKRGETITVFFERRPVLEYSDPAPIRCRKLGFIFSPIEIDVHRPSLLAVSEVRLFQ
jgi:hypothetical protein